MICHGKYTFRQMQSVFVCLFQCWSVCAVLVYYVLWSSSSLMSISLLVDLRFVGLKAIRWIYITHRSYAYHSNTHTHIVCTHKFILLNFNFAITIISTNCNCVCLYAATFVLCVFCIYSRHKNQSNYAKQYSNWTPFSGRLDDRNNRIIEIHILKWKCVCVCMCACIRSKYETG